MTAMAKNDVIIMLFFDQLKIKLIKRMYVQLFRIV